MSLVGYARVSTTEGRQVLDRQLDALNAAGCERVFEDHASGAASDRPNLTACLDYLRAGDVLVVLDLDRLGRLAGELITLIDALGERRIAERLMVLAEHSSDAHDSPDATVVSIGPALIFERLWRETGCQAVVRKLLATRTVGRCAQAPATVHLLRTTYQLSVCPTMCRLGRMGSLAGTAGRPHVFGRSRNVVVHDPFKRDDEGHCSAPGTARIQYRPMG